MKVVEMSKRREGEDVWQIDAVARDAKTEALSGNLCLIVQAN